MIIFLRLRDFFNKPFVVFFVLEFIVLLLWWFSFYPAVLSSDSIEQWRQATSFQFNDWHPYLHTLLLAGLRQLWDSPAVMVLFQILCTAFLFAYIFHYLWNKEVNRYLLVVCFALVLVSVPVGINTVNLWKDTLFSLALVGMAFSVMVVFFEKKAPSKLQFLMLLLSAIAVIQFRKNGIIYIGFLPVLLFIYFGKKIWIRWFISLVIVLFLSLQYWLFGILEVEPTPELYRNIPVYHATAGFYARMPLTIMTTASKRFMEKLFSPEDLVSKYNPIAVDSIFWSDRLNRELLSSSEFKTIVEADFYRYNLWINLPTYLGDRVNMFVATVFGYNSLYSDSIDINAYGLKLTPILSQLHDVLVRLLNFTRGNLLLLVMVWSAWLGCVLCFVLFVDSIYRRRYHFQIFASILLVQMPFLFFLSPSASWRYVYFMYLALLIIFPIYYLPIKDSDSNATK